MIKGILILLVIFVLQIFNFQAKTVTLQAKTITKTDEISFLKKYLESSNLAFEINGENFNLDFLYTNQNLLNSKICFGEPDDQCIDVILDTGSYVLWVTSSNCNSSTCPKVKYYPSKISENTGEKYSIQYATGNTEGYLYKDKITFNHKTKSSPLVFLNADKSSFPTQTSYGILGLGRNYSSKAVNKKETSIIEALIDSNQIDNRVFSFKWKDYYYGELVIGDYPEELKASKFENYKTCPVINLPNPKENEKLFQDAYWSCLSSAFVFNDKIQNKKDIVSKDVAVVFDTGANMFLAPKADMNLFVLKFTPSGCNLIENQVILCTSSTNFDLLPDFGFKINDVEYTIKGKDFVKPLDSSAGGYSYMINVIFADTSFWLLGTPFLRRFLIVYDKDKNEVGLTPNLADIEKPSNLLLILLIVGAVIIIACIALYVFCFRRKRSQTDIEQGLVNN